MLDTDLLQHLQRLEATPGDVLLLTLPDMASIDLDTLTRCRRELAWAGYPFIVLLCEGEDLGGLAHYSDERLASFGLRRLEAVDA